MDYAELGIKNIQKVICMKLNSILMKNIGEFFEIESGPFKILPQILKTRIHICSYRYIWFEEEQSTFI